MSDLVKRDKFAKLPVEWTGTAKNMEVLDTAYGAINSSGTHGIVAGIPIVCRGKQCPFLETCVLETLHVDVDTIKGQRCPIEISKIMKLFNDYVEQFDIDLDNADKVVIGLIKELIDYEIQIERADKRMAQQGDFLEDVVVGIDSNGRPIKNKEIAKPIDYKERALKKKHDILQLLNSTPKDKAGTKVNITMDPSTYAAHLLAKFNDLKEAGVIVDAEYTMEDDTMENDENE